MRLQKILEKVGCLLACCDSQIIVENLQLDGKLPENDQGGASEEDIL